MIITYIIFLIILFIAVKIGYDFGTIEDENIGFLQRIFMCVVAAIVYMSFLNIVVFEIMKMFNVW